MTTRQRKLINKYLTKKDKETLSQEFTIGEEAVRLKLKGERNAGEEFMLRALNLAEQRKRLRDQVSKKFKKLAS